MFATLSDRLQDTFKNLRGKGRLSEADIDATAREIRITSDRSEVVRASCKIVIGDGLEGGSARSAVAVVAVAVSIAVFTVPRRAEGTV